MRSMVRWPDSPAASVPIGRQSPLRYACHGPMAEGHITKLKLVKRQMYGRGKIDLLQARLIGAA
jgi:hypothetical protein